MGHGAMNCAMKTIRFLMVVINTIFLVSRKATRNRIFFFNVDFFFNQLIGLALIGLGIYLMVDPSLQKIKEFLPIDSSELKICCFRSINIFLYRSDPGIERGLSYLEVAAIVIIVLGGILTLFGFFGCCGAMKQVKCLLIIVSRFSL